MYTPFDVELCTSSLALFLGLSVPTPTEPPEVIRTFSELAVQNLRESPSFAYLINPLASLVVSPKITPTSSEVPALTDKKVLPESWTTSFLVGLSVPTPTEPLEVIRSLSDPSVVTLKCPLEPVSTTSASVLPSKILSAVDVPVPSVP